MTVEEGGKSLGNARHWHPVASTYWMALKTSRKVRLARAPQASLFGQHRFDDRPFFVCHVAFVASAVTFIILPSGPVPRHVIPPSGVVTNSEDHMSGPLTTLGTDSESGFRSHVWPIYAIMLRALVRHRRFPYRRAKNALSSPLRRSDGLPAQLTLRDSFLARPVSAGCDAAHQDRWRPQRLVCRTSIQHMGSSGVGFLRFWRAFSLRALLSGMEPPLPPLSGGNF